MQNEDAARPRPRQQKDIAARTFSFAKRVVAVVRAMKPDVAATVIARQLMRSGTSVGANVEEAEAAHSKTEFIQKMNIARKEARETLYWLRIVRDCEMVNKTERLSEIADEAEQIVRIITAIVKNARSSG